MCTSVGGLLGCFHIVGVVERTPNLGRLSLQSRGIWRAPGNTREADLDVTARGSFIGEILGRHVSHRGDRGVDPESLKVGKARGFLEVTHNWQIQMVHSYFWRGITSARSTCNLVSQQCG